MCLCFHTFFFKKIRYLGWTPTITFHNIGFPQNRQYLFREVIINSWFHISEFFLSSLFCGLIFIVNKFDNKYWKAGKLDKIFKIVMHQGKKHFSNTNLEIFSLVKNNFLKSIKTHLWNVFTVPCFSFSKFSTINILFLCRCNYFVSL